MLYLSGSRALNHYDSQRFIINDDTDWDFISNEDIQKSELIDVAPDGIMSFEIAEKYKTDITVDTPIGPATLVSPVGIMLMKRSHLHRPLKFDKHIRDYHWLKDEFGHAIDPEYNFLLAQRTKLTKEKFGDKTPKLNKSKRDFFDDYVKKIYDHDAIHYAIAFYEEPVYERLKPDKDMVWCSKKKWDQLTHEMQIKCVVEESAVIAIERFLIPDRKYPQRFAYNKALAKVCTTLTSGWFRDFAIENWPAIMEYANGDWYKRFLSVENTLKKYGE